MPQNPRPLLSKLGKPETGGSEEAYTARNSLKSKTSGSGLKKTSYLVNQQRNKAEVPL